MNYTRLALAIIAAFLFVFGFEFFYHGVLLKPLYEQTMSLWRSDEQMMALMPVAIGIQFLFALLTVIIFAGFAPQTGLKQGVRYGALLGLLIGLLQFGQLTYLPIPFELATAWFAGSFFETLVVGILAGLIYRKV